MRIKIIIKQVILKISFSISLSLVCLITVGGQTNQMPDEPLDNPTVVTTACEEWIARVSQALTEWNKNKKGSVIVIVRLGDGEYSRRINLKRIKTLKEYILVPRWKIKVVFAEGERVGGDGGIIEIYVEGKLIDALRVGPKSDIPLRGCNP